MEKTCVCCKKGITPHPAVPDQRYCGKLECQRARKRKWQKDKLAKDSDYRQDQAAAQQEWCSRNKDYWKEYRKRNPAYTEQNRIRQRERNCKRRTRSVIAKMDEQKAENAIPSGCYLLSPVPDGKVAKMDELIVEISVVSMGCAIGLQRGP